MTLPTAWPPPAPRSDLPVLTLLRLPLVWWFVAWQMTQHGLFGVPGGLLLHVLEKGAVVPDCAFMLSGFLLAHAHPEFAVPGYRQKSVPMTRQMVGRFALHRLGRLYPLHLVVLGLFAVLALGGAVRGGAAQWVMQVLFVQGWGVAGRPGFDTASWAVSALWGASLLAPFIIRGTWWLQFDVPTTLPPVFLAIYALALNFELFHAPWLFLPRAVLGVAMGVAICRLRDRDFNMLRNIRRPALWGLWAALAASALLGGPWLFLALFPVLMLFLGADYGARPTPAERVGLYLGRTAFAVYLVQGLVLAALSGFAPPLPAPLTVLALIAIIQALASVLHALVENPARRLTPPVAG